MKAFLLAAGVGSRLKPLTDTTPKCLVPIKGKPLLQIWLELLQKHGITEVLINMHARAEAVRRFLAGRFSALEIKLVEEYHLLGSAGTLAVNRDWIGGDADYWVLYADVLTNVRLEKLLRFHLHHPSAATLGVYRVPDPKRCGVVATDQTGRVVAFIEKPKDPSGDLAFAGILIGTQALLDAIPPKRPADIGFDVLPRLVGQMFAYPIDDFLLDIGTIENYTHAQVVWEGI
jgi:mannose-1-phosphate guanylyltransferase